MNWKAISRNIGYALLVSALFMFLSVLVSLLNGKDSALGPLTISFTITFICGIFPFIFVRRTSAISLKDGYVIITLSWFLSFVFGMLPYALWGGPFTLSNAWFESVSGFTTTGATILENVEALPKSLLFWRAATHFIGGLGVVVFLLLVIPGSNQMKMRLTNLELSSLSRGASTRANRTVLIFAYIYLGLGLVSFLAYWIAGMSPFDAVCHSMSVSATGGFSTRNASIAAFDSRIIELLTMIFMFVSSINFGIVFLTLMTRSFKPLRNPILQFYSGAVALLAVLLAIGLKSEGLCETWGNAVWNGFFSILCISSTTGFAIMDNSVWPSTLCLLSLSAAVACGCAGSTSGGMKVDRVMVMFKAVARQVNRILHPSSVNEIKLGNRILRDEEVFPHLLYIAMYCFILAVSVLLCMLVGVNNHNSFAASITSLSNVGPAIEEFGTMGSFNSAPNAAKFVFTMDMFFGRIEIYPILAVVAMIFDRRHR